MSPSLDFDDVVATGPALDVWGTLATGLTVGALAFVASGIAYAFAVEGSARERVEAAAERGMGGLTAILVLGATLALWEASRRDHRSMRSGAGTLLLVLGAIVLAGSIYSAGHLATVEINDRFAELRNTEWQRTGFILFRLAAGAIAAGAVVILMRTRATDDSVEVA